jgi:hypothetical protein
MDEPASSTASLPPGLGPASEPGEGILTATRGLHAPPELQPGSGRRQRRFVLAVLVAAVAIVALVAAANALVDPYGSLGTGVIGPAVWTDRAAKVQLIQRLSQPPRIIVLGSSRAMKVQPSYLTSLTGLPAFNAAVSSGRPVDAYVFAEYLHQRYPQTHQSYLWLLDQEAFADNVIDPTLLADGTLARYLPSATRVRGRLSDLGWLLSWHTLRLSWQTLRHNAAAKTATAAGASPTAAPTTQDDSQPQFAADGYRTQDANSRAAARGRPLSKGIAESSTIFVRRYRSAFPGLAATPRQFFERSLAAMNAWGATPVIVLTPMQPQLLRQVRPIGWDARHRDVLAYLHGLQKRYRFVLVDMSLLSSFGGSPQAFYDGVHMMPGNYRKMVRALMALPAARAALTQASAGQTSAGS